MFSQLKTALYLVVASFGALGIALVGCSSETNVSEGDEHVGVADQALTVAQCNYFSVNGKVQICHRTASQTTPYTVL